MNKNVDVLNEMERASCRLFDAGLHGDLSLDVARDAVAELIEAATALRARLCLHGDWEDRCFYYNGYSAPELMAPMADVDSALARVKGA